MPRFIELVSRNVVDANRWFKNGDHPDDYAHPIHDSEGGRPFVYSSQHQRNEGWEGQVVRYFRDPSVDGRITCDTCGHVMHEHGHIDAPGGGYTVCPGDWVVTSATGVNYPCKADVFGITHQPISED